MIEENILRRVAFFLSYEQEFLENFEERFATMYMQREYMKQLDVLVRSEKIAEAKKLISKIKKEAWDNDKRRDCFL